jgi:hypothetical protein
MSGAGQLDQVRQSRSSIIVLGVSLGGLYYATQVNLKYQNVWWDVPLALLSFVVFLLGVGLVYEDWKRETKHWDMSIRNLEARTQRVQNQKSEKDTNAGATGWAGEDQEISDRPRRL